VLKIIKSNQPIPVKQITVTVYALPGIGKTSLAFSAGALLIDTDKGAYRSANRGDTVQPASWSEIANLTASDLEGYQAVALDTAGRALDMLSAHILENDPKMGRKSGDLSLQGFGALKSSFISWLKRLHACGKDVILLSHLDEKQEGDIIKDRLDIQGGSKAEIYKCSDAMAKLYIEGKARKLDFSPREGALGKNPAQFDILTVPNFTVEPQYFAGVIGDIKKALNKMSESQTQAQDEIEGWRKLLNACKNAADFNSLLPQAVKADHSVKVLIMAVATDKGLKFDKDEKAFYAPSTPGVAQTPTEPEKAPETVTESQDGASHVPGEIYRQEVSVTEVEQRSKGGKQWMLLDCEIYEETGGTGNSDNMDEPAHDTYGIALQCWHKNTMFGHLKTSKGKACEFGIMRHEVGDSVHYTIEEIHRIGDLQFSKNQPLASPSGKQMGF